MRTLQVGDWVSHVNRPGEYGQIVRLSEDAACIEMHTSTLAGYMYSWDWFPKSDLLRVIPAPALPKGDSNEDK